MDDREKLFSLLFLGLLSNSKVVNESYESIEIDGKFYIKLITEYADGIRDVSTIPDVRRNLQQQLNEAVEDQKFEKAAKLRDTIKQLNYEHE